MEWTTSFFYGLCVYICCLLLSTQSAPHYNYHDQSFIRTNTSRKLPAHSETHHQNRYDDDDILLNTPHRERHGKETHFTSTTGPIRGLKRNVFGKEIYVYYGIPFAIPPLGDLRFKKPVPIPTWTHPLNAVNLPNSCFQEKYSEFPGFRGEEIWNPSTNVSEDCLYLNLWVPKSGVTRMKHHMKSYNSLDDFKGLPILVWIYGGGYMSGSTALDIYNGDILAGENDCIVAAMNYRVGAFGFLYFGNDDAPGKIYF